jgi:hypothetical protein
VQCRAFVSGRIPTHGATCDGPETHDFERLIDGVLWSSQQTPMHFQIFPARQVQIERGRFHQRSNASECGQIRGISENTDYPSIRALQAKNDSDRRGFPRPVRPQKAVNASWRYGEAQTADSDGIPVSLPDVLEPDYGLNVLARVHHEHMDTAKTPEVPRAAIADLISD